MLGSQPWIRTRRFYHLTFGVRFTVANNYRIVKRFLRVEALPSLDNLAEPCASVGLQADFTTRGRRRALHSWRTEGSLFPNRGLLPRPGGIRQYLPSMRRVCRVCGPGPVPPLAYHCIPAQALHLDALTPVRRWRWHVLELCGPAVGLAQQKCAPALPASPEGAARVDSEESLLLLGCGAPSGACPIRSSLGHTGCVPGHRLGGGGVVEWWGDAAPAAPLHARLDHLDALNIRWESIHLDDPRAVQVGLDGRVAQDEFPQ
jgi:hypothetical protein